MEKRKKSTFVSQKEDMSSMINQPEETVKNNRNVFNIPNIIFIGLLVVCAYFIGALTTKVQYLEKKNSEVAANAAQADNNQAPPAAQPTVGEFPKISSRDHIRGDKNARIALIEYSDFECPYCKQFHMTMLQVIKEYQGKVMWVYRHFPLDFHPNAQKEAEASECVYELGGNDAFWKYADAIYERTTSNGTGFALDKLGPLAAEIGISEQKFKDCLDSGRYEKYVKDDRSGGTKAGIQGTPGTIILDTKTGKTQMIPGALPYTSIKSMLDSFLK